MTKKSAPVKTFDRYLRVKRSTIPKSGKGLFTTVDIPKGGLVCEYKGRLARWRDMKDEDGYNGYIFKINRIWAIDAQRMLSAKGRYANDARGLSRAPGCRNNAEYITRGLKCYISTTRRLRAGEEVFVDYGQAYWRLIRKLIREGGI
jgi:uncharacterized protein